MKFKEYLQERASLELVKKLNVFKETIQSIKLTDFVKAISNTTDFLNKTVKDTVISKLEDQQNKIVIGLEVQTKQLLKIKHTLQTSFFDSTIKQCYSLVSEVKEHFKTERKLYNKGVRNS